ncbi:MAG: imidazole glycerol phosphate synthase subunit HisH [Calditrichaeota bacterium]|nr:imidazole glycerol phosphate synthase subunit HisH [Calditrichota bacterium]
MKVAILKYNAGNIYSVQLALNRLGYPAILTDEPQVLEAADKIIFPGVGEARSAMAYLQQRGLDAWLVQTRQPVLGICLGLQLLCEFSEENQTPGLGIFPVRVRRFPPKGKVPHMGWNTIGQLKGPLFNGISEGAYVYFVHSYYPELTPLTTARTEYLVPFSAAIERDNFFGVQFHPEKSGTVGEKILRNFLEL